MITLYMYDEEVDFYGPVIFALINSKEKDCYDLMYKEINHVLGDISIELKLKNLLILNY